MKIKKYYCKNCWKEFQKFNSLQKTCTKKCQDLLDKEKRKAKKEQKAMSISVLSKLADKKWSECVRSIGYCEYCGSKDNLNAHHIFSRHNKSVRWELSNGICLCAKHHTFSDEFSSHKTPTEFTRRLDNYKGKWYLDTLQELAHTPLKVTSEYLQERIKFFKNQLDLFNN